jgi:hypothetical protein
LYELFWLLEIIYQQLDPDPDTGDKFNADPCGSGYGSGSETLLKTTQNMNEKNHVLK